jgi:hypothetical protein
MNRQTDTGPDNKRHKAIGKQTEYDTQTRRTAGSV